MTDLLPHHDGSALHVSDDAPALGDVVRVRLRVPAGYGPLAAVRQPAAALGRPFCSSSMMSGAKAVTRAP